MTRTVVVRVVYPRSWLRRVLHLPARYRRHVTPAWWPFEDLDGSA